MAVLSASIPSPQAITIDEDNPTQHTSDIDEGLAVQLGQEGLKTRHLRTC